MVSAQVQTCSSSERFCSWYCPALSNPMNPEDDDLILAIKERENGNREARLMLWVWEVDLRHHSHRAWLCAQWDQFGTVY